MGKKTYVRNGTIAAFVVLVLLFGGCAYGYLVYRGYVLLNNPSHSRYPVRGVDVSHYQEEIDWPVLAGEGITFAYIKATEGSSHVDDRFAGNWESAGKTGLDVGAYHFFSFDSPGMAQAEHYIGQVGTREGMLPPVVDVEYYGDKKVNPPPEEPVRAELQGMLDRLEEQYGVMPVVYSTEEVWEKYLKGYFDQYPLWIRNVFTRPVSSADWTLWQYTNRGRLKGYTGAEEFIDINVFRGDEAEWEQWKTGKGRQP